MPKAKLIPASQAQSKNKGPIDINVLGADDVDMMSKRTNKPLFKEEELESFETSVASSRKMSKIVAQ